MLSLMKGLTDLPQLLVFVEWKSYENPSIIQTVSFALFWQNAFLVYRKLKF